MEELKKTIQSNPLQWGVAGVVGFLVFVIVATNRTPDTPQPQAVAPVQQAVPEPVAIATLDPTLAPATQSVLPQHEEMPVYFEHGGEDAAYLVLDQPIGAAGQLNVELVYNAEESSRLLSNCFDIRQKRSKADMQLGEYDGISTTFADYSQWILRGAIALCE
jgi:hypothetical protein